MYNYVVKIRVEDKLTSQVSTQELLIEVLKEMNKNNTESGSFIDKTKLVEVTFIHEKDSTNDHYLGIVVEYRGLE